MPVPRRTRPSAALRRFSQAGSFLFAAACLGGLPSGTAWGQERVAGEDAASRAGPVAAARGPAAHLPALHLDVQERILENGVTVLVWERPSAGRIGARVFYRVDIAAERPGTVGLTHMLEHYLFMGSHRVGTTDWKAERPFAEAVERIEREITDERNRNRACFLQREVFAEVEAECSTPRLDSLEVALQEAFEAQHRFASGTDFDWIYQPAGGTGLTASTGRDWMKFDIDLPAEALELFMWMERSRVENPVFRFFEPEREVVVDQIRRADNRPDGPFQRVLRSMTYDAHPYGWAHWFSDLTRATREDHWEIFHRYFIPQNTILVVVGDVEAEEVFRQAERYWGSWEMGRPSPRLRTVEPPPVGQKRLEVEAAAGPSVVVQVPMPAVGHPDAPVFEVLAQLLGGDRGLLERSLVEEAGIATSTDASAWLAKYPSHLTLRADARSNEELGAVEAGIDSVLTRIAAGDVEGDRLQAVVDRMVLAMARGLERIGPSGVQIGAMEAIHGWNHLNEQPALWAAVTPQDLARVVERYLAPEMRTVGILRRTEAPTTTAASRWEGSPQLPGREGPARPLAEEGTWTTGSGPAVSAVPGGPVEELARGSSERPTGASLSLSDVPGTDAVRRDRSEGEIPSSDLFRNDSPLAEQPWYGPPWMADRRPSRFTEPPPVEGWEELSPPAVAPRLPRASNHRVEVDGGWRAFVVPDDLLPLAQISALVQARTVDEPRGKEGLAELTGRMVMLGGGGELDPEALESRLRELGASLSVEVDEHHTRFHLLAPPASTPEAARIMGRLIAHPRLDPGVLERERAREAVRAERAMDDAGAVLRDLFHRTLFPPEHPLARRPTGGSVEGLDREDVVRFHRARYGPDAVVFALSGRFEVDAVVRELGEGLSGEGTGDAGGGSSGFVAGRVPAPLPPPVAAGPRVVTRDLPTSRQGHVMLGHRGLDSIPRDHAALEIMNYILAGGAFVSRMMELLRTDTGITSALYGSVEPGSGAPFPYVWRFSGNPETLARGVRLAVEEIERIRRDGVTEREFEGARTSYLQGLIPASYETSHLAAERFAQRELLGRYLYQSPGYLNYYAGDETQVEAILALTLEEVNEAARRYLHPDEVVVAVVGPLEEIRRGATPEDRPFVTASTEPGGASSEGR
jgi:predicted Zn-dependent peptidase